MVLITMGMVSSCMNKVEMNYFWSENTERVLVDLGEYRTKYEPLIVHYQTDSLKREAATFLLDHIGVHFSVNMYWQDSLGRLVEFNELNYPDFDSSIDAFDQLKQKHGQLRPVLYNYYDVDTVSVDFLIKSIDQAFGVWRQPWAKDLSFEDFCDYILPYRSMTEPVQDWFVAYSDRYGWLTDSLSHQGYDYEACMLISDAIKNDFMNQWGLGIRQEIPLKGPLNANHQNRGECADRVNFSTYSLRSQGVPAVVDMVPYWATTAGRHYWNATLDHTGKQNYFQGGMDYPGGYVITRELPKVYRYTYREQPNSIASRVKDSIPDPILRSKNLKDMTAKYIQTVNLTVQLDKVHASQPIYLTVFNGMKWRPVCGEFADDNGTVVFPDMGYGIVYTPARVKDDKFVSIHAPIAVDHSGSITVLNPDLGAKRAFVMLQQEEYLMYRPGSEYKLYYWDKGWRLIDTQIYKRGERLNFSEVYKNALYLMIPEYSWGKERPFTMDAEGNRVWW